MAKFNITKEALRKRGWKQSRKGSNGSYWYHSPVLKGGFIKSPKVKAPKFKLEDYNSRDEKDKYGKGIIGPMTFYQAHFTSDTIKGKEVFYPVYTGIRDVDTLEELDKIFGALEFTSK